MVCNMSRSRDTNEDWERERRLDRDFERETRGYRRRPVAIGGRLRSLLIGVNATPEGEQS